MTWAERTTKIFRSTHFKLALWNALFLSFSLLLLGFYAHNYLQKSLYKEARAFLGHEALEVSHFYRNKLSLSNFEDDAHKELEEQKNYAASYAVISKSGDWISQSKNFPEILKKENIETWYKKAIPDQATFEVLKTNDENEYTLAMCQTLATEQESSHLIVVVSNLNFVVKKMNHFQEKFFWITPLLFLITILLGWGLSLLAMSPIRSMRKKIESFSVKNLTQKIPTRNTDDDLDRLANAFNQMASRIKSAYDQMTQFTSAVSHELRTPITIMKNDIEISLSKPRDVAEYRDILSNQLVELERLSNLVNDMLLLARYESSETPLNKTKLSVAEVTEDVINYYLPLLEDGQIELIKEMDKKALIYANETLIKQTFSNLFQNAIKHTPPGGSITINSICQKDKVVITFSDTGCGISEKDLDKVFDRFFRTNTSRDPNNIGYGLGLAIVKTVITIHQGSIKAQSELGSGSRFIISLPLYSE